MARSRIEIVGDSPEHQSDGALAMRAGTGDREAFEELYRRHSRTAMRVAYRVTGNIHDASDAVSDAFARVMQALPEGRLTEPTRFRSYLLTATRHAAVDVLRRAGRAVPSDTEAEPAQTTAGPSEMLMDRADNALVAAAFRALPERWRSVLWLTEVEGIPAREAAPMLGVSANGVAQLAVRARAGLRERYLQAHLPVVEGDCHEAVSRLGAYVGGALPARELSRVDQHLASCEDCRGRETDLREIGTTLRKAALPVPVVAGGGGLGIGRWLWDLAERAGRAVSSLGSSGAEAVASKVAPVGAAAAAVFVASVASIGVVDQPAATPAVPRSAAVAPPAAAIGSAAGPSSSSEAAVAAPSTSSAPAEVDRSGRTAVVWRPPASTSTTTAVAADEADDEQALSTTTTTAPPKRSTTTTTTAAPPPASEGDDDPDVVEEVVEVVDDVVTTTTLPLPVPVPPLGGAVGEVVDEVGGLLPLDVESVVFQALMGAVDEVAFTLWFAEPDAPLPSPEAPGLPV